MGDAACDHLTTSRSLKVDTTRHLLVSIRGGG